MGLGTTLVLGFVAGATILLGLPIGRLRRPAPTLRALLNAIAVGVLLFLVWDVLSAAWAPIDTALGTLVPGHAGCPATACLHWGLLRGETYLDPLLLLRPPRLRLLPPEPGD